MTENSAQKQPLTPEAGPLRRLLTRLGVLLWPALCLLGVNGCNEVCGASCADNYSNCVGGSADPLLEQHCQISYDSCMESCDTAEAEEEKDAGPPFDVTGAGTGRE